ncbi:MAG: hypothetical protein JSS82_08980 [Bacteroidetes bacterium]|nr:hypothetical protein [Bacteroidota bacterium]
MYELKHINEPFLLFNHNQRVIDPRDGLTLFGPFNKNKINNFSIGIIGTETGVSRMKSWISKFLKPIPAYKNDPAKPFYPGFEAIFGVTINLNSTVELKIDESAMLQYYKYSDSHVRIAKMVDAYTERLMESEKDDDRPPVDLWFVVIPEEIYLVGRPKSKAISKDVIKVGIKDRYTRENKGLFDEIDPELAKTKESYKYENHFHNQLKLKLLKHEILTQIVRESTIAYREPEFRKKNNEPKRDLSTMETDIAWNIATSVYYKIGGLPWKLGSIRKGVCYIGLVFKVDERQSERNYACCAAQMFLDSGDGMVFKGAVGPWYNEETREFHLTKEAASDLLQKAISSFQKTNNQLPKEVFIHGRTFFDDEEWEGFNDIASKNEIKLVGVTIKDEKIFKLYRDKNFPILRGSYYAKDNNNAYLWTKGFIPRVQQPLGLETPNPITIKLTRGKGFISIDTICRDILALTKLNYNSCRFCDGMPVTLKFANMIGDILTAGPIDDIKIALPFKYYI